MQYSLISDAQTGSNTFEQFCSDMDLDTDSRRALDTYMACQAVVAPLRRLLGSEWSAACEAASDY